MVSQLWGLNNVVLTFLRTQGPLVKDNGLSSILHFTIFLNREKTEEKERRSRRRSKNAKRKKDKLHTSNLAFGRPVCKGPCGVSLKLIPQLSLMPTALRQLCPTPLSNNFSIIIHTSLFLSSFSLHFFSSKSYSHRSVENYIHTHI